MTEVTTALDEESPRQRPISSRTTLAALVTLVLIALGDFLTFGHAPGLNLFIFAIAGMLGIVAGHPKRSSIKSTAITFALSVAAALPLIEAPSLVAAGLASIGLAVLALVRARLVPARLTALPLTLCRFALRAPLRLVADLSVAASRGLGLRLARGLVIWIIPAALALVFLGLFWSANPVLADLLGKFDASLLDPSRMAFWLGIAIVAWPLLRPRLKRWRTRPAIRAAAMPAAANLLFGQAAILRSLALFNALFAVETGLDLTYLWGGVALPDGMSHAEYAHRGAYPLIVTALLAAVFVLVAMRRNGPAVGSALIRGLVYAWIAQNILLCISSILRLEQYVEAYSLSELRIAAGIWMALVAAGLGLILLRILFRRSNEWLVAMNLATLALTLYVCAFLDFSALIAEFNVRHSAELTGTGASLDICYVEALGPSTIPALDLYIAAPKGRLNEANSCDPEQVRGQLATEFAARDHDWRSWNFRDWRLAQYLGSHP